MEKFETYAKNKTALINNFLKDYIKNYQGHVSQRFGPLLESMDYSLGGEGKRLRPLLIVASAECVGIPEEDILPAACAMEYIHTASLVHDDMPAMDDDDMRRGKPSNHKKFGEPIALLTGDALLTEAFGLMAQLQGRGRFSTEQILSAIELLVHYTGVRGMMGGQLLDVTAEHPTYNLPEVEFIHIHKTGALILGSVLLPTRLKMVDADLVLKLRRYGEAIGLAFQISDDLLDSEASIRYSRGPRKKPKPCYSHFMSATEMRQKVNGLVDSAVDNVSPLGHKAEPLISIAEFIRNRKS